MLKHIVMWRFKEGAEGQSAAEHAAWMQRSLEALVGVVPEIVHLECGRDMLHTEASFDLVLTVVVEHEAALTAYAQHPEHQKIAQRAKLITEQRVVVDYLLEA